MRSFLHSSRKAFTLVEMMIGITIFSIGMGGIYLLLESATSSAQYSRHEIVAANLLREQIELVKNMRGSNWRSFRPWDIARVGNTAGGVNTLELTPGIYTVENDFSTEKATYDGTLGLSALPVKITGGLTLPVKPTDMFIDASPFRLCLDRQNRYTHSCTVDTKITSYASYLEIQPLSYTPSETVASGYILTAHVIVGNRTTARDYDMKTILTDWKR